MKVDENVLKERKPVWQRRYFLKLSRESGTNLQQTFE